MIRASEFKPVTLADGRVLIPGDGPILWAHLCPSGLKVEFQNTADKTDHTSGVIIQAKDLPEATKLLVLDERVKELLPGAPSPVTDVLAGYLRDNPKVDPELLTPERILMIYRQTQKGHRFDIQFHLERWTLQPCHRCNALTLGWNNDTGRDLPTCEDCQ